MKEIILVRHGKSSWQYAVSDRDRPLQERGIKDALLVAGALSGLPRPDAVFSSPANRALHTCTILMRELRIPLERVMLFGHNHAFTALANAWGNRGIDNVPTTGVVHLRFDVARWADLSRGQTRAAVFPKNLK